MDGAKNPLAPVTSATRADEVARRLIEMIRGGAYAPGACLPTGRRLTALFGVSQPTVREALRTLEALGFVSIRHGSGIYVTPGNPLNGVWSTRWMRWTLQHADSLLNLLGVQEAVEGKAALLAARNGKPRDLHRLEGLLQEAERLLDRHESDDVSEGLLAAYLDLDVAFHGRLAKAGRNDLLTGMVGAVGSVLQGSREATLAIPGRMRRSLAEHRMILDTVRRRDADGARRAMETHVRRVEDEVRSIDHQSRHRRKAGNPSTKRAKQI